jgi:hypothetical protein
MQSSCIARFFSQGDFRRNSLIINKDSTRIRTEDLLITVVFRSHNRGCGPSMPLGSMGPWRKPESASCAPIVTHTGPPRQTRSPPSFANPGINFSGRMGGSFHWDRGDDADGGHCVLPGDSRGDTTDADVMLLQATRCCAHVGSLRSQPCWVCYRDRGGCARWRCFPRIH